MKIGELNQRIQIQSHDGTKDDCGTLAESGWQEYWTCWAAKKDLSGREYFRAVEVGSDVSTEFTIRYKEGITAKMRVLLNEVKYDIEAVQDKDGRKSELTLLTKRRDA